MMRLTCAAILSLAVAVPVFAQDEAVLEEAPLVEITTRSPDEVAEEQAAPVVEAVMGEVQAVTPAQPEAMAENAADPVITEAMPTAAALPPAPALDESMMDMGPPEPDPLTTEDYKAFLRDYLADLGIQGGMRFYDRVSRKEMTLTFDSFSKEEAMIIGTGVCVIPVKFKTDEGRSLLLDMTVAGIEEAELVVIPRRTALRKAGREKARYYWEQDERTGNWTKEYPEAESDSDQAG